MSEGNDKQDPRVYFAAERTLLAYVRTGLAMMGFGFVVARFGLFLRELASIRVESAPRRFGVSLWAGTALVMLGVVVNLYAAYRYWSTVRRLDRGEPIRVRPLSLGTILAVTLAILGLAVAGYLIMGLHDAE